MQTLPSNQNAAINLRRVSELPNNIPVIGGLAVFELEFLGRRTPWF
jgi:hypothetical protein